MVKKAYTKSFEYLKDLDLNDLSFNRTIIEDVLNILFKEINFQNQFSIKELFEKIPFSAKDKISALKILLDNGVLIKDEANRDICIFVKKLNKKQIEFLMFAHIDLIYIERYAKSKTFTNMLTNSQEKVG